MATIFFTGLCVRDEIGTATASYAAVIFPDGGAGPICLSSHLGSPLPAEEAAALVALGKGLRLLSECKLPAGPLVLIGDCRPVVDWLGGKSEPGDKGLRNLLKGCGDIVRGLGPESLSAQWIPRDQNEQAAALARSAYVGYTGKPAPAPKAEDTKSAAG